MQGLYAGKTALVTDSNSGIGKVVAQQLAEPGAHVILSGRDKARGDPRPQSAS
jgi:NAD(P)-dependent dehydrogenase (short-subunit alcohol dehydrogenase family)